MLLNHLSAGLVLACVVSAHTSTHPQLKRRHHARAASLADRGCKDKQSTSAAAADVAAATGGVTRGTLPVQRLIAEHDAATDVIIQGHWVVETVVTSNFVPISTVAAGSSAKSPASPPAPAAPSATSPLVAQENAPKPATATPATTHANANAQPAATSLSTTAGGQATLPAPAQASSSGSGHSAPVVFSGTKRKHVFAHFMVGIVSTYGQADWEKDIRLAKSKGITGFALNIGIDDYTQKQLDLGYAAAQAVGDFDAFISFDFNWYKVGDVQGVKDMLGRYINHPAQLKIDGKPFVSTFIGDGFDWAGVAKQLGTELYSVPFWQPSQDAAQNAGNAGLFSWDAWPGQPNNQPVQRNMTANRDMEYINLLKPAGKKYMAPVSPWFFTHFGKEVSYSKNWLFYSEALWKTRWDQILEMSDDLEFLEIVTWNDYGESHYIGPYGTAHTDDGSSKWAEGLDHTAMLDMAVPYIEAFQAGAKQPTIRDEMLVYWHRPHLKTAKCDGTDNCGSAPAGWDMVEDVVFVAAMTKGGATVTVTSGNNAPVQRTVAAGVEVFAVPMGLGTQRFSLKLASGAVVDGSSVVPITDQCWKGIYNFNFHSGTLKV